MSATVLLLKTQTRILAWPLFVLLAAWLISAVIPLDAVQVLVGIAVLLAGALSGPIVFGAEYVEGARDYLSTRPIAPWKVFWSKTLLLVAVAWLCALIVGRAVPVQEILEWDLVRVVERPARLLFPVVLAMSFWGAFCTVLCRDLVRGLLYGGLSFTILAALLGALQWMFFEAYRPPINFEVLHIQAYVFQSLFLALAPFPILGLLQTGYATQSTHRFRLGWILPIAIAAVMGALSLAAYSMKSDGQVEYQSFGRGTGMAASRIRNGKLYYVVDEQDLRIHTLDLKSSENLDTTEFKKKGLSVSNRYFPEGSVEGNTVVLFPYDRESNKKGVSLYRIDDASQLSKIYSIEKVHSALFRKQGFLSIRPDEDRTKTYSINLSSGEVLNEGPDEAIISPTDTLVDGEWVYRSRRRSVEMRGPLIPGTSSTRSGSFRVAAPAVNGGRLVGFDLDSASADFTSFGGELSTLLPTLFLHDFMQFSVAEIQIPARLHRIVQKVIEGLDWVGLRPEVFWDRHNPVYLHPSLGGDYLFLWMGGAHLGRVAIWNVADPEHPRFIGILPNPIGFLPEPQLSEAGIQGPLQPIERDDGSLGILVDPRSILWLEIPGRMKEPQT